uniref:DUF4817 domain-containing protein n=1 Tax=Caenorhabditis tropicalis TaxID=1561998 RepID=A0A1I7URU9_9PELO
MVCNKDCVRQRKERKLRCKSRHIIFSERERELCETCLEVHIEPTEEEIEEKRISRERYEAAVLAKESEWRRSISIAAHDRLSPRTKLSYQRSFENIRRRFPTAPMAEVRKKAIEYMRRREREEMKVLFDEDRLSDRTKAAQRRVPRNYFEAVQLWKMGRHRNKLLNKRQSSSSSHVHPSPGHRFNEGQSSNAQDQPSTSSHSEIPVITID